MIKKNKKILIALLILTSLIMASCSKMNENKEQKKVEVRNQEIAIKIGTLWEIESDDGLLFKASRNEEGKLMFNVQDTTKDDSNPIFMTDILTFDKDGKWFKPLILRDGEKYIYSISERAVTRENFINNFSKYALFSGMEYNDEDHYYIDLGYESVDPEEAEDFEADWILESFESIKDELVRDRIVQGADEYEFQWMVSDESGVYYYVAKDNKDNIKVIVQDLSQGGGIGTPFLIKKFECLDDCQTIKFIEENHKDRFTTTIVKGNGVYLHSYNK